MCRLAAIVGALYVIALIASSPASAQDRDCSDFDTQAEAQDSTNKPGRGTPTSSTRTTTAAHVTRTRAPAAARV
jgi:hypothetical protein